MKHILDHGEKKQDRTGTGTLSVFGYQARYSWNRFPQLTTKKVHLKSIIHELLWFLSGDQNIQYLKENKVKIWDDWADEDGNLGPIYGVQWRSWKAPNGQSIDQISQVIKDIQTNPHSRRHLVVAYNPGEVEQTLLQRPCRSLRMTTSRCTSE